MPSYIPDGYTADDSIAPIKGLHDGLEFQYRPMLKDERDEWVDKAGRVQKLPAKNAVWRQMLIKHLVSWNVTDQKGDVLPIDDETLKRVQPELIDRLANILMGWQPGDSSAQSEADSKN